MVCMVNSSASAFAGPITLKTSSASFANAASYTVNMPSGIVTGDRLMCVLVVNTNATITFPGGWNLVEDNAGPVIYRYVIYERVADGTEGASITVAPGSSQKACWETMRFSGAHASAASEKGTANSGTTANPDPPSISPSWGASALTYFLALVITRRGDMTVSAYPTNYGSDNALDTSDGTTTGGAIARASRLLGASSEDPGTYTLGASIAISAQTVAIRPA